MCKLMFVYVITLWWCVAYACMYVCVCVCVCACVYACSPWCLKREWCEEIATRLYCLQSIVYYYSTSVGLRWFASWRRSCLLYSTSLYSMHHHLMYTIISGQAMARLLPTALVILFLASHKLSLSSNMSCQGTHCNHWFFKYLLWTQSYAVDLQIHEGMFTIKMKMGTLGPRPFSH